MKKIIAYTYTLSLFLLLSCGNNKTTESTTSSEPNTLSGQSGVKDDVSAKDVVKIAAGSADHTTLVSAIKQAELVDALSNAGPFTVFAPTNAAFDKVPKETLDNLMKDANKTQLQDILQYHVYVGSLKTDLMEDGQSLNMVNGGNITVSRKDGKLMVNNTENVITSIPASNGIIHTIEAMLLPPAKN